ncbi:MAG: hypothetical protein KGJ02_07215 [Verrucomicrobiota bacterium]|nr:hypothetical protein [Verrucomicrobiota bacterium]
MVDSETQEIEGELARCTAANKEVVPKAYRFYSMEGEQLLNILDDKIAKLKAGQLNALSNAELQFLIRHQEVGKTLHQKARNELKKMVQLFQPVGLEEASPLSGSKPWLAIEVEEKL